MSLRARTYLLVLLPLTGLAAFVAWGWWERTGTLEEASRVVERVDLLGSGGELIHAVQLERGRTAGWLEEGGEGPAAGLGEVRRAVDRAALAWLYADPGAEGAHTRSIDERRRDLPSLLDSISVVRRAVDRRGITTAETAAFYTRVNGAVLEVVRREARAMEDAGVSASGAAYLSLLRLKEAAGIERGLVHAALTRGEFLPGERDSLIAVAWEQENLARALRAGPGDVPWDRLEPGAAHPTTARAIEVRTRVLEGGPGAPGVGAETWFQLQTARIEALRELEREALGALESTARELRARMERERAAFALAGLGILLLTLGGASLSARSVRGPLEQLRRALERVGGEGRPHAARLAERGPPEVAGISRAFNAFAGRLQEAVRRLEDSEARFAGILEISVDAIISVDEAQRIVLFNQGAEEIFGYPADEVLGRPLDALIPERHRRAHRDHVRTFRSSSIRARRMGERQEISGLRRDGEEFPAEASISRLDLGAETLLTVVLQDITDRRRAEDELARYARELERSNAELEQFAYVASHDLQEPLRMVASYTRLLARRYEGKLDPDADELIGYAVEGADRMRELIDALLTYSRAGRRGGDFGLIEMDVVLDRTLENLTVAVEESGAEVSRGALPTVHGDEVQLVQLFQNLIGNALRFRSDDPPRIHVSAERSEGPGEWVISVRDNGIGIEKEHLDRIFLIFQRLHGRRGYAGTGIGLSIAKKIVEGHDGRIWVESEPGRGSTFHFTVPDRD